MNTLRVQKRNMETKAKRLRREGFVTGVVYGRNLEETIPIQIPVKEAERVLRECPRGSQLYLEIEDRTYDVLLKELEYDSMKKQVLEMDFQSLVKGEKVHCTTEIILHNKDKVSEGVLDQLLEEVSYKALPEDIQNSIDLDCSTLRLGDTITVGDLDIAKNPKIVLITHKNQPIVSVIAVHQTEETETEAAEE